MNTIDLNDRKPLFVSPTLQSINKNALITPCIKIVIPALTTVSISDKLIVNGPGGNIDASIINIPVGLLYDMLTTAGIQVEIYKDDMRYRNAALLENFSSITKFHISNTESPINLNKFFYETYINNLLPASQPSISILSATNKNVPTHYELINGKLYIAENSIVNFSTSIQEAVINIQTYKAYNAADLIANDTHSLSKNIIINKINELNKAQ